MIFQYQKAKVFQKAFMLNIILFEKIGCTLKNFDIKK